MLNHQSDFYVYDLDTTLNFPEVLCSYFEKAFRPKMKKLVKYNPSFRVVNAIDFLKNFSSDRSHMLNNEGTLLAPAPSYLPIQNGTTKMNLHSYISMSNLKDSHFGKVFSMKAFQIEYKLIPEENEDKSMEFENQILLSNKCLKSS